MPTSARVRTACVALTAALRAAASVTVVAAVAVPPATAAGEAPAYPAGAASFQANCSVCHGPAGGGIPALAPPLSSNPARYASGAEGRRQLAMTVLYGLFGDITVDGRHYDFRMPDFARLDDATLAATLNFVVFGLAHAPAEVAPLTAGELAAERAHPVDGAAVREHRKLVAPLPATPAAPPPAAIAAPPPATPAAPPPAAIAAPPAAAQNYTLYCMGCHGAQAQGVPGKIPPLAGSLARFMRSPQGRDYVLRVPGAASSALGDAELAAVLNWLAERFAAPHEPVAAPFTAAEVTQARRVPLADVQARRREVVRALAATGGRSP